MPLPRSIRSLRHPVRWRWGQQPQIFESCVTHFKTLESARDLLRLHSMIRHFIICLLLGTTACVGGQDEVSSSRDETPNGEDDSNQSDEPDLGAAQCVVAGDCVLAASNCCDCPSFAVNVGDGYQGACEDVECPTAGLCPAVEASCDEAGQCLMICSPIITDKSCEFGFANDALGCLLDECAVAPDADEGGCTVDEDCVRIALDCCGCGQGGEDGAVVAAEATAFTSGLSCQDNPQCPGIDVCEPEQVPRCMSNTCVLAPMTKAEPPASADLRCGTPEFPACDVGQDCVLNDVSAKDASTLGVGICRAE